MTPQELKNSILQLAIQGKLVEQRPEEGTAEELYKQIQAEKQALIKAGKIKKEKPLPEITEDEKPFEIPESWKWVRFGFCGVLKSGFAFKSIEYTPSGIQVVRISDLAENLISERDAVYYPFNASLDAYLITYNSFLICLTGSIGKMAWVQDKTPRYLNQRVGMFEPVNNCDTSYLWWFLHTGSVLNQWVASKTSTNGNIKNSDVTELLLPLPPLPEQKRIVAKIEELLPLIDRYEKAWIRLEDFNKRFPGDMQKSILQMAIQGKLVEQRPEEGTGEELYKQIQAEKQALIKAGRIKKEKPLEDFTSEETELSIPDSWYFCKLSSISSKITDGEHKTPRRVPDFCGYYLLSARNIRDGYISLDDVDFVDREEFENISSRCNPQKGDLLISCSGSVGRSAVVIDDNNYVMVRSAAMISPVMIDSLYLMLTIQTEYVQEQIRNRTKQTAQANLFQDAIRNLVIPLPPLEEQRRIVAKLEELLPLCERLK